MIRNKYNENWHSKQSSTVPGIALGVTVNLRATLETTHNFAVFVWF